MSIVKHHKLKTEKTGHIYSIANPQAFRHWMLCHGYAMTAEQIVHKFKDLDEDNNFYEEGYYFEMDESRFVGNGQFRKKIQYVKLIPKATSLKL